MTDTGIDQAVTQNQNDQDEEKAVSSDIITGSEVEILEGDVVLMSRDEATRRTEALRDNLRLNLNEIAELRQRQIWRSLNYETWDEYWQSEFAGYRAPRVNAAERKEIVETLADTEVPGAVIAQMFSVSKATISRDLAGIDRARSDTGQEPRSRSIRTTTGTTRTRRVAKPPAIREKSFEERFDFATLELVAASARLNELAEDPKFTHYLPALKANHVEEIARVSKGMEALLDQMLEA